MTVLWARPAHRCAGLAHRTAGHRPTCWLGGWNPWDSQGDHFGLARVPRFSPPSGCPRVPPRRGEWSNPTTHTPSRTPPSRLTTGLAGRRHGQPADSTRHESAPCQRICLRVSGQIDRFWFGRGSDILVTEQKRGAKVPTCHMSCPDQTKNCRFAH